MPAVLLYGQVYKSLHGRGNIATILAAILKCTMRGHTHAHVVVMPSHMVVMPLHRQNMYTTTTLTYATSIVASMLNDNMLLFAIIQLLYHVNTLVNKRLLNLIKLAPITI